MTKKLTISALLVALAMILGYVEVLIPFNFGIPGIKLGLANLVVVVALYLLNARQALMISVVRILLVSFTFGNMAALLYSITGGLLSFAVMVLCRRIKGLSTMSVSVAGGISHNIGQILVAVFVVKNLNLLFYLPVLMIAGIITGLLIGLVAALLYSITGGLLSFAVMVLCRRIKGLSTMSVSVAGGISHNIGQILVAVFVVKNLNLLFYLPVLMIAGIITGLLIGLVAGLIIPSVRKALQL